MSEELRQRGEHREIQANTSVLQSLRGKLNLKASLIAGAIGAVLTSCEPDKEMTTTPNQAPELRVSIKEVSTTNFVLKLDYADDKEGGTIDYIIKDKTTGTQIADGHISADKKTLYIGGLQPEQSYQANLEAIDSEGKETPKSIDITTSVVEQLAAPTLDTNILNILENSTEAVQVIIISEQDIEDVIVTGETANHLDLQSVERIGETNDYIIALKPHDLDREIEDTHLGGLNVETSTGTTELTLNISVENENEATPTLFGEEENQRGDTGEYFVFKLEDSDNNWFYTHNGELMDETQVSTAVNETGAFTGSMISMLGTMNIHEVLPKHPNGVPYLNVQGSDIFFQDENETNIKDIDYDLFRNLFAYMRDRILVEGLEEFSNENGFSHSDYFSGAFQGNLCEDFATDLLTKLYTDYANTETPIAAASIAKFVTEKRLYTSTETE